MIAMNSSPDYDCILVGGGLQSGLIALALHHFHPEARVLMIERESKLAGNHTWSFHPQDVPAACRSWLDSLVQHRWRDYEIRIGPFRRTIDLEYASISSTHFSEQLTQLFHHSQSGGVGSLDRVVEMAIVGASTQKLQPMPESSTQRQMLFDSGHHWRLLSDTTVETINETSVTTDCGQTFQAGLVIDCRGPGQHVSYAGCGYQKFYGFEIEVDTDWPEGRPVVMEAIDDQQDGFRFLYSLPLGPRRVLVEDTRFSDTANLDRQECWQVVLESLQRQGIEHFRIVREESGVLPMPFSGERLPSASSPLAGGYSGGWFHAATGYSFPMAVAFAQALCSGPLETSRSRIDHLSEQHRWRALYSRFLNRLLFRLVTPKDRYRIFERFYRVLGNDAVARFYAHQFRTWDAVRIVVGVPPTLLGLRPFRFLSSFFRGAKP